MPDIRDPESMEKDDQLDEFSSSSTEFHHQQLSRLKEQVDAVPWTDARYSLLAMPARNPNSGKTVESTGCIGINERMLGPAVPPEVALNIAIHERTHLQVAASLRRALFGEHDDVDAFFHGQVLPGWKSGEISLEGKIDRNFLTQKDYKPLIPEWNQLRGIEFADVKNAGNRYFTQMKKGLLWRVDDRIYCQDVEYRALKIEETPSKSPEELYAHDPEKFLVELLTGYQLIEELYKKYCWEIMRKTGRDVLDLEEGFTNFVACQLTGMKPAGLQRWARQDASKLIMAEKLLWTGKPAVEAVREVQSLPDLIGLYQRVGVLKK